jgi:hypothetical protein
MNAPRPARSPNRSAARRTVLVLALLALAIYAAFILGGVFGFTGTPVR